MILKQVIVVIDRLVNKRQLEVAFSGAPDGLQAALRPPFGRSSARKLAGG